MKVRSRTWGRWRATVEACARASVAALVLNGCADRYEDVGDVVVEWDGGDSQVSLALRRSRVVEELADALNRTFKLPVDLVVMHASCAEKNAFYDPQQRRITMCYELLEAVAEVAWKQSRMDEARYEDTVIATWTFFLFHELGHALIHLYDLPIPGSEEDVVDGFSTVLLIKSEMARSALVAAKYWAETDPGKYSDLAFASDHSLNPQRFYNIICLVYGSSVEAYREVVERNVLPESRADRCPGEYRQALHAWEILLEKWTQS